MHRGIIYLRTDVKLVVGWIYARSRNFWDAIWALARAVEPKFKFQDPAPGIYKSFCFGSSIYKFRLRLQNDLIHWKLIDNHCIICATRLTHTISVESEPKFPAPPSKTFWIRLQPSEIAWAPAPQPWLKLFCP